MLGLKFNHVSKRGHTGEQRVLGYLMLVPLSGAYSHMTGNRQKHLAQSDDTKSVAWPPLLELLSWYPLILVKSLLIIWRSGTRRRVLDLHMGFSGFTNCYVASLVVPVMVTRATCPNLLHQTRYYRELFFSPSTLRKRLRCRHCLHTCLAYFGSCDLGIGPEWPSNPYPKRLRRPLHNILWQWYSLSVASRPNHNANGHLTKRLRELKTATENRKS